MTRRYREHAPTRAEVDALAGATVLEFGTDWCGYCIAAEPLVSGALAGHNVRHIPIEDGRGRPLGRSYRVKLWPTLIFLQDGREVARLVRPSDQASIAGAVARISTGSGYDAPGTGGRER